MLRHGAAIHRPAAGALATRLLALLALALTCALAACADGASAPTASTHAPAGAIGEAAAVDVGGDPIRALLLDTLFVAASSKDRADVEAAYGNLALLKAGEQDCPDAHFLVDLALSALAAGTLGPTPGAEDAGTPKRVNTLLGWLAPRCKDVPPSLPAAALGPNGLAVPVAPGQAYILKTRDGAFVLDVPANAFDRPTVLVATRVPFATSAPGGPFATTLPVFGPMYRLTAVPAALRTGTLDFGVAHGDDRAPPSAALGHLAPIFGNPSNVGIGGIRATIGLASRYYDGSPSYLDPPVRPRLPRPSSTPRGRGGSTSGSIPTFETFCENIDDCLSRAFSLRARADLRAFGPAAADVVPPAPLPFDLVLGYARVYDPAVNGRLALGATPVCGLRFTITNAAGVDLVAIFQPVDANGAPVGATGRRPVLVPAKGSRAVRLTLPPNVPPSAVAAMQLLYGPTLVKSVRPSPNACPATSA
jgi:hypothetical protein